ncbi:Very long-chain acyl-CoA synthetase [Triplophysa tibetana]|uniref:Very long-chain acyl-CoA synthetase n=1 Tax=Triplophysa tibetana TaxID=1572043 RepID=A0A5A9P3I5_9TELE|nr:Very long-chain acyl-CoA synthetase [Triplophysa tibetana]
MAGVEGVKFLKQQLQTAVEEVTPKRELQAALFVSQRLVDKEHDVRLAIGNGLRADVWRNFHQRFGSIEVREFVDFVDYAGRVGGIGRISCLHKAVNIYFNSGDLLRIDLDGFICFQDRVRDTFRLIDCDSVFRWKAENISTTEVSDIIGFSGFGGGGVMSLTRCLSSGQRDAWEWLR